MLCFADLAGGADCEGLQAAVRDAGDVRDPRDAAAPEVVQVEVPPPPRHDDLHVRSGRLTCRFAPYSRPGQDR